MSELRGVTCDLGKTLRAHFAKRGGAYLERDHEGAEAALPDAVMFAIAAHGRRIETIREELCKALVASMESHDAVTDPGENLSVTHLLFALGAAS